jgi:putative ABC transport system permease protein
MAFVNFSPRLMILHDDLPATHLIQPGSRVSYRLWASSSEASALKAFDAELLPQLAAGQRFESVDNARPELRATLDRAQAFLSLTGMVSVLTASAALWMSARQMSRGLRPRVAVWKSLGASFGFIRGVVIRLLLSLVVLGGGLGLAMGFGLQHLLSSLLAGLLAVPLPDFPPAAWVTVAQGLLLTAGLLAVLAWPVVSETLRAPAIESLRGVGHTSAPIPSRARRSLQLLVAWVGLTLVMGLGSGQFSLAVWVSLGFGLMGLLVWGLLAGLTKTLGLALASRPRLPWLLQGLKRVLLRRSAGLSAQVLGLGLALSALFLLAFVRGDLVEAWGRSLPIDAPNRFLLNVLPGEESSVLSLLRAHGVRDPVLSPMVRGRMVEKNGQPVTPSDFSEDRAKRLLDREMNLTYATEIPAHNRLVGGRPLNPQRAEVSVEEGIARTLGIRLGDRLVFDVAGDRVEAEVTSLRRVRWDSMTVNFFMVLSPSLIDEQAKTWISSFYVNPSSGAQLSRGLMNAHPGLTIVELDAVLAQLRRVLTQVVTAVQALFGLSLFAGLLVLWAALVASRSERGQEAALLRAFGASARQIAQAQALELSLVGLVAGLASALLAQVLGGAVAQQFFELPVQFNLSAVLLGALAGVLLTLVSGQLALRPVLRQPAMAALRQSDPSGVVVSR